MDTIQTTDSPSLFQSSDEQLLITAQPHMMIQQYINCEDYDKGPAPATISYSQFVIQGINLCQEYEKMFKKIVFALLKAYKE